MGKRLTHLYIYICIYIDIHIHIYCTSRRGVVKPLVFLCMHLALLARCHLFSRQTTRNSRHNAHTQRGSLSATTWKYGSSFLALGLKLNPSVTHLDHQTQSWEVRAGCWVSLYHRRTSPIIIFINNEEKSVSVWAVSTFSLSSLRQNVCTTSNIYVDGIRKCNEQCF